MSPTADPSVSQTVGHRFVQGEPALIHVPGYEYVDGTEQELKDLSADDMIASINKDSPGAITGHSWHWVEDGEATFVLELMEMAPKYALRVPERGGLNAFANGFAKAKDHRVSPLVISTEPVVMESHTGSGGGTWVYYIWIHDGSLTTVSGVDCETEVLAFVKAYLVAAHT